MINKKYFICGSRVHYKTSNTCSLICREKMRFLNKIEFIQSQFDYPLKDIIESLYNEGLSMKQICEMLGYNPTSSHCHIKLFNYFKIKRRPIGGKKPGGITDPHSRAFKENRIRMIENNPSCDPKIRAKMNIGYRQYLLKTQSEMTKMVADILRKYGINFIQEKMEGKYLIDFAIGNIALEIDGRGHYSHSSRDKIKDTFLASKGWKIIRINGDSRYLHRLRRKLKELILSGQISGRNILPSGKHSMISGNI